MVFFNILSSSVFDFEVDFCVIYVLFFLGYFCNISIGGIDIFGVDRGDILSSKEVVVVNYFGYVNGFDRNGYDFGGYKENGKILLKFLSLFYIK